jgi:Tfp pilus assembly protein PilF
MREKIWAKISYIAGLLPVGAIFGLLVYVANVEIKDFDLWLHLAVGKFITLHKYVPGADFLSCTITGEHWVNHEWLFQVLLYNLYNAFGPSGILKMQIVVVLLTMLLLLFLGDTKNKQLSTSFILLLVYLVYQQRFTIRPDIFSLLFFAVYIYILALHIDKKWVVPFLSLIQVLWSNMHGFFFFGPLFVLIGIVSEWTKRHIQLPYEWNETGRLTDTEYKRIKVTFLFVSLACLANPSFIHGALYPISVFFGLSGENKVFFEYIQELQRPVSWASLWQRNQFIYYKLLILLSAISFVFNRRRIDISALFFWLVFLIFSLQAIRNTVFFAFAAYLVFITNILSLSYKDVVPVRFADKKFLHITSTVVKILLVLWIFNYCRGISTKAYFDFDTHRYKSEFGGVSLNSYPNKAADFLVENNIEGNFFNDFNSGAYLLGRTFPNIKVFIDGRTEVYGGTFFKRYRKIWEKGDIELFENAVEEYDLTGVFLNASRYHIPVKLLRYLYHHEDWAVVYFNYDAMILLKRIPSNQKMIQAYEMDLEQWRAPNNDLYKFGAENVLAFQNYFRAYTLESLDFDEAALSECMEAVQLTPTYAKAYQLIGKIFTKEDDYATAFKNYRVASILSPGDRKIRYNLALAYYDLGDYYHATEEYALMTQRWPQDPKAYFHLAKAALMNKEYPRSLMALQKARDLDPNNYKDTKEIADLAYTAKEYTLAQKMYGMVLDAKKKAPDVHKKLGYIYQQTGQNDRAQESFNQALSLDPKNTALREELRGLLE